MKKEFPDSQIHFLTLEENASLLEGIPSIDRLHLLEKSTGVFQLISVGNYLNKCRYDVVVDMHDSLRSKIIRNRMRSSLHHYLKKPRWKRFKLFEFHQNDFQNDFSQLRLFHSVIKEILSQNNHSLPSLFVSENEKEVRNFESIAFWSDYLQKAGFKDDGRRLLQENDPSDNTLMAFIKE